jgi:hypothetical protein
MRVISEQLRKSARGQNCTLRLDGCFRGNETVVLCHVPGIGMRGWGMKSPDLFACFGCQSCHDILDGRKLGDCSFQDVLRAMCETQMIWVDLGLITIAEVNK